MTQLGLPFLVARRYLVAKKSQNVINIISAISALGVMVATAAIVIVLSVFNGLNGLVSSLFGSFDPDLRVDAAQGKYFVLTDEMRALMESDPDVVAWAEVVQDNALVRYGKRQVPATLMGVGSNYSKVTDIDSIVIDGRFVPGRCLVGALLAEQLMVSSIAFDPTVELYAPKREGKVSLANPQSSFVNVTAPVSGTFMVQQAEYDGTYVLCGLQQARELFGYPDGVVTSLSLRLAPGSDVQAAAERITAALEGIAPGGTVVKDKWRQHESFFKMMEIEKFMSFLILLFIVLIAAFNIIGSLSMLIFEKKGSIAVFRSMGADEAFVTRIFLFEGWLVSVGGALLGLALGIAVVLAQERWGIVRFGSGYVVDAYPVELLWSDVAVVFVSVVTLAALAAWYPVKVIVRRYFRGE